MKSNSFDTKIEKLAAKRAQIEQREKLLKQKERKLKIKQLIEIGQLAIKAGIDDLNSPTLLGAFVEIKEKSKDARIKKDWLEQGNGFLDVDMKTNAQPLIVSFSLESEEAKQLLKKLRFRWNAFRKEWYGYGKVDEIKVAMEKFDGMVEVANG